MSVQAQPSPRPPGAGDSPDADPPGRQPARSPSWTRPRRGPQAADSKALYARAEPAGEAPAAGAGVPRARRQETLGRASKRPRGGPEPRPPPAPARQPAPRPPRAAWAASESPGHRRAEPSRAEPSERALPSRAEAGRAAQRSPDQPSAAQPGAAESRPPAGKQRAPAPRAPPRPGSREPGTTKRVSSQTGPQRGHPRERSGAWHSLTRPLCPEQPRSPPRLSGLSRPDKAGQGTPV
ncbi:proline-rich protein HaeIII subfamily 1-like [Bubalus bubalis]|uniref:proline-rich protein HaeIII subfamily 1-like n=1 Tax=Bubalus bubalis TaxID=89462 RepID=UPI001D10FC94|nr:proline-rich protein HaeIII subfamily 1-like [Bubalus bubalis]